MPLFFWCSPIGIIFWQSSWWALQQNWPTTSKFQAQVRIFFPSWLCSLLKEHLTYSTFRCIWFDLSIISPFSTIYPLASQRYFPQFFKKAVLSPIFRIKAISFLLFLGKPSQHMTNCTCWLVVESLMTQVTISYCLLRTSFLTCYKLCSSNKRYDSRSDWLKTWISFRIINLDFRNISSFFASSLSKYCHS